MSRIAQHAKGFEGEGPAAVVAGDFFERQIAADGVELVEIRMHFAHTGGVFAEARDGILPLGAIGLHVAGEHEIVDAGEGGFELVVRGLGFGENDVDRDCGGMRGGDAARDHRRGRRACRSGRRISSACDCRWRG